MKLLCSLIVLLAITYTSALTDEQKTKLEKASKPCRELSGLTLEETEKVRNGEELRDTPVMRKHVLCLLKKLGLATESGDILVDKLRPVIAKAIGERQLDAIGHVDEIGQVNTIINKCMVTKATPEETVINLGICIRATVPNFLPVN